MSRFKFALPTLSLGSVIGLSLVFSNGLLSAYGSGLIRGDVDWKGASAPLLLCSSGANAPFQSITDAGALVTSR